MKKVISEFKYNYYFLSNFYPCQIIDEYNILYPSVEHAYQAAKTFDEKIRKTISKLKTPVKAKTYGKKIKLRKYWDTLKEEIMFKLLIKKFSIPELKEKLLETKNCKLVEGNFWGDTFWGECDGIGENNLGKMLMYIRDYILKED